MASILIADREGRYLDANAEALELLGVSFEQVRAARIGDFSGVHGSLSAQVWRRLASLGIPMPIGESTMYHADGTPIRVRYSRLEPRADGAYVIQFAPVELTEEDPDGPPVADRPSEILEQWRVAEREVENGDTNGARTGANALRDFYQLSLAERTRELADGRGASKR